MSLLEYALILGLVVTLAFCGLLVMRPRLEALYEEVIAELDTSVAPTPTPEVATVPSARPDLVAVSISPAEQPELFSDKPEALFVFVLVGLASVTLIIIGLMLHIGVLPLNNGGVIGKPRTAQYPHGQCTLSDGEAGQLNRIIVAKETQLRIHQDMLDSLEVRKATYHFVEVPLSLLNEIDYRKKEIRRLSREINRLRSKLKCLRKRS